MKYPNCTFPCPAPARSAEAPPRRPLTLAVGAALLFIHTADAATFRYASSSHRIYVENGGTATLSQIKDALPSAPLQLVDATNKIWLLRANLFVTDGCTLQLHGSAAGGDVNELRLLSNNAGATNSVASVDADWGTVDLHTTRVTSWDEAVNGPDTEYQTYQRAFIRARSRQVSGTNQQSTLNISYSDIGYLGAKGSESYGLTWQIVGSVEGLKVFGYLGGNRIHHCQLGLSTWSADDVNWVGNEIEHNTLNGFDSSNPGHRGVVANNTLHDNDYAPIFRWSGSSQRIYITGAGSTTLSEVKAGQPGAPLTLVDSTNQVWFLGANLMVEKGAKLDLHGPAIGGDVAELRLKSDNSTNAYSFIEVRADWGSLDIRNTKITSWDSAVGGPDLETDVYGRAYVRARSTLDPDGVTARESRMDIVDSEVCYLGWHASESYGLTWKVVDTTAIYLPPGSTKSLFDVVNVYGDILNSRLHHNFFGVYTYGHAGGRWATNEVHHNAWYGFDPHDDSDSVVIEFNDVHDNGRHGIIASRRCDHIVIRNNRSWANGGNGIMLHRHSDDGLVENNQCESNGDSGISLFDSDRAIVRNNLCRSNLNAGIRVSMGCADNLVTENELGHNATVGLYVYVGDDPPEPDDVDPTLSARCRRNEFATNLVYGTGGPAVKLTSCDSNVFAGNVFTGSEATLRFDSGTNNLLVANSLPADAQVRVLSASTNFNTTLFKLQPRINLDIDDAYSAASFLDESGAIFDFGASGVATLAGPGGSVATVTGAELTNTTTVITRKLFVVPDAGSVNVVPRAWQTVQAVDLQRTSWDAQASNGTTSVRYRACCLQPGQAYGVVVSSAVEPLGPYVADSEGFVTFVVTDADAPLTQPARWTLGQTNAPPGSTPPVLPAQEDRAITELSPLAVTNTAAGSTPFTYSLATAPSGATISANGIISWTPTEAQGPATNLFTTVVTDTNSPPLSATNQFFVMVSEANLAPTLPQLTYRVVDELTAVIVTNTAVDADLPANTLSYTLLAAPPTASISANGVISWTPSEAESPRTEIFTTRVADNGSPTLTSTNSFTVYVEEVNSAPVLPFQPDRTLGPFATLTVTNTANDPDLPPNSLSYELAEAPPGAMIDQNGVITWTSPGSPSTNRFTTIVTDDGVPSLRSANSFSVYVSGPQTNSLNIAHTPTNSVILSWPATSPDWSLQRNTSLITPNWVDVTNQTTLSDNTGGEPRYQVTLWPLTENEYFRLYPPQQ